MKNLVVPEGELRLLHLFIFFSYFLYQCFFLLIYLIEWLTDRSASRPKMKLFISTIIILSLFTQIFHRFWLTLIFRLIPHKSACFDLIWKMWAGILLQSLYMSSDSLAVKSWLQRELKNMAKEFMAIFKTEQLYFWLQNINAVSYFFLLKLLPRFASKFLLHLVILKFC